MNQVFFLILLIWVLFFSSGCSHQAIQETYWRAGTTVASDDEKKGKIHEAETELQVALARAKRELSDDKIAISLRNLGGFYRRQKRFNDSIYYLNEALKLEERVSGPASERTGRTLAELAATYHMEGNMFEGRPYANRLEPLAKYYSGNEKFFIRKVLEVYKIDTEKYNRDVAQLKPLAASGDPKAQYQLASVYFDGPDAKELIPKTLKLYESSAKQGFSEAQYYLGVIYDKGRGVAKDDEKAREWYRIAAHNNHSNGQFNYGVFLMQGRGGPKNENKAWDWIKKSSAQGNSSAQKALRQYNK
jgi:TPR repeat protein